MKLPEDNLTDFAHVRDGFPDRREGRRFALLIRSAKLSTEHGEFLCIVRDVSEQGVRLKFFHPVPPSLDMRLALSTGDDFPIEQVWDNSGHAGFRFVDPIDVPRFIAEAGPYPKRPVRLRVNFPITIVVDGQPSEARIIDISRQGARIETDRRLALSQKMRIESDQLPEIEATVCWRDTPAYGLVFSQVLSLEELAVRTATAQLGDRLKALSSARGEVLRGAT